MVSFVRICDVYNLCIEWKFDCGGHKADYATEKFTNAKIAQVLIILAAKLADDESTNQEIDVWNQVLGAVLKLDFKK